MAQFENAGSIINPTPRQSNILMKLDAQLITDIENRNFNLLKLRSIGRHDLKRILGKGRNDLRKLRWIPVTVLWLTIVLS